MKKGQETNKGIAIIGMFGRFPDAEGVDEFFQNCLDGVKSIKEISDDELIKEGVSRELLENENYIKYGATIEDIDKFDHNFFNFTVNEAKITDPQHRVFLECSWKALENSGYIPSKYDGKIAVFGSNSVNSYLLNNLLRNKKITNEGVSYETLIGSDKDFLCTRVSYKLNLTGPSVTVQSGCSSSLVAVHLACQCLLNGETDIALAGGVSISVPQKTGYFYKAGSTFSKDGQCRPFDIDSSGMIKGNGCGLVVLKELDKAIQDNDYIYAVIKGTAINNDGKQKIGYTAPSIKGQAEVIQSAVEKAEINPDDFVYVEAHGTGTALGDPIEIRALTKAFGTSKKQYCAIGSVKANVGHLDVASGVTGLIKTAFVLNKGIIPKNINYKASNPQINFSSTPFYVNTENIELDKNSKNYAAVSSFGIGGTNAHVIVESFVNQRSEVKKGKNYIVPLSAKTEIALEQIKIQLQKFLNESEDTFINLRDIAYTLCYGREDFCCREFIIASNLNELIQKLSDSINKKDNNSNTSTDISDMYELGVKWVRGAKVQWNFQFENDMPGRIQLPTYQFEKKSFWIDPDDDSITNKASDKKESNYDILMDREGILKEVINIWKKNLGYDEIGDGDDFYELGGESLVALDIVSDINSKYRTHIPIDFLINFTTPKAIADFLFEKFSREGKTSLGTNIIHKVVDGKSTRNLFMIHPAGGNIYCYKELAQYLENFINVYAIQFPENIAIGDNDAYLIEELAHKYLQEVEKIQDKGPFLLGGYSFGGNVALEMALQLEEKGEKVESIVMIDSLVPETYSRQIPGEDHYVKAFQLILDMTMGNAILSKEEYEDRLNGMSLSEIIEQMKQEKRISEKISTEELLDFFKLWMCNHMALTKHIPKGKVDSNIIIFSADEELPGYIYDVIKMKKTCATLWQNYTNKEVDMIPIDGNHYSIMGDKQKMKNLADNINEKLSSYGNAAL